VAFANQLRAIVRADSPPRVVFYDEFLDLDRFPENARREELVNYIVEKYRGFSFDAILTDGTRALRFATTQNSHMPGVYRRFQCAAVAGLLVLAAEWSEAQPAARHVLLLQSFDRGNMTDDYTTANLRVDLGQRIGQAVNVVEIVVGPTGFVGAPEHVIVDYIRSAFADRPKPDLIVTLAGPAAAFARKYRQQLFPDVPLLLASVNQQYLRDAPLGENETAVAVVSDFPGVIDLILELLPQTKQVFVVVGSGQSGTFWSRELQTRFTRFQDRLTFIWSGGLSLTKSCAGGSLTRLGDLVFPGTDGGGAYADARVLADLHATANAPIFGTHSVMLGTGIVGGNLIDIDDVTRNTADAAIRVLAGAPPRSVIVPPQTPGHPVFDWRELQRWGIPESRLPAGSVVRYRDPSLWRQHRARCSAPSACWPHS
jgi:hypothetical protein